MASRTKVVYDLKARPQRGFLTVEPQNEHEAELMPDDCHDGCGRCGPFSSTYFPFHWRDGVAWYLCTEGHLWTCWWAAGQTQGTAPGNAGRAVERYYFHPDDLRAWNDVIGGGTR